mmetsp:Transcript_41210/g.74507  ORF Transcript_41210/g.74507 Transcript_41210/m.74507 type:complete len:85 (+) Transcript_41210:855-1109(+)
MLPDEALGMAVLPADKVPVMNGVVAVPGQVPLMHNGGCLVCRGCGGCLTSSVREEAGFGGAVDRQPMYGAGPLERSKLAPVASA